MERLLAQLECSFNQLRFLKGDERRRQNELEIKSLQIMRAMIHNEIINADPDLKDRAPQLFRNHCQLRVQPIQDSIQNMGNAVARLLPLLSHPSDDVVCEVLAFLKALLYSGNHHIQEGMSIILDTREETIFKTMESLLRNAAITFDERLV